MKIFLAGCDGLLGQNLAAVAADRGHEVIGASRHPEPSRPGLLSAHHVMDITDREAWGFVRDRIRPDRIVNAAAYTDVDGCERDPELCDRVNRDAVRWMAETGIPVVQVSTDYVFDGKAGPYAEDAPVNPLSRYGRAKLESEAVVLASKDGLVVRTTLVWGLEKGAKKSFTEFVRETLAAGKPVKAVTDQVGNPTLARDLAGAIGSLLEAGRAGLYHAAGAGRMSRYEWALRVAEAYGLDGSLVHPIDTPSLHLAAARPLDGGLVCEKLARDTGFRLRGLPGQLEAALSSPDPR